jgi:Fe-S oxidoreductase
MEYRFNFISPTDFSIIDRQIVKIRSGDLIPLPYSDEPEFTKPNPEWGEKYVTELDGYIAIDEPWKPKTKEEEIALVNKFLDGLKKLLDKESNWTYLKPLLLFLENCTKCNVCAEACPIYISSGRKEIYNPLFRAEILRKIIFKHFGKFRLHLKDREFEVNARTVMRLAELAYRCTLCRRCTVACPIGVDNALLTREIRKVFSQELGIAPRPLHEQGTISHLLDGSSVGLSPEGFKSLLAEVEAEIEQITGKKYRLPVDVKGVDILLVHSILDYIYYPETIASLAIILEEAGYEWTLSSKVPALDAVNYGMWYDDVQLARIALKHADAAIELDVDRIVVGESGHGHSTLLAAADRFFTEEHDIPRESYIPLLWDIVKKREIKVDMDVNDFPVTLHDPCHMVRFLGIVKPQRNILREICPQFREMHPNGVYNYCCGGGSGFAIMNSMNFPEWRNKVASRMKLKQIFDAFGADLDPHSRKYVCAPCSNCKKTVSEALSYYNLADKYRIRCGGIAELVVNSMVGVETRVLKSYI